MSVRLKDLADRVGVSISTVSRVINNDKIKPASKATADKVWAAALEMGYRPDLRARNLVYGEDGNFYKSVPRQFGCLYAYANESLEDPFFSPIVSGIKEQLESDGYELKFVNAVYGHSYEALGKFAEDNYVEGLIIMGRFDQDYLHVLTEKYNHIIYVGINPLNNDIDEVICDGYTGIGKVVDYLTSMGHQKIGFVGDKRNDGITDLINEYRFDGYCDALAQNGLTKNEDFIVNVWPYPEKAYEGVRQYLLGRDLADLPTAFVCMNDYSAIGTLKALNERNISVPEQISVTGFDNHEVGLYMQPALTTIDVPKKEMGKMSVRILLDRIDNNRDYSVQINIPYELVIRDSVRHL